MAEISSYTTYDELKTPEIFNNLAKVLEHGRKYLDQHTRYAINFVLKYYDPNSITFSPSYSNYFRGTSLKKECQNHLDKLNHDVAKNVEGDREIVELKLNLINLLNQVYFQF